MTRLAQFAAALLFILQCVAVSAGDDRINIILGADPPLLEEFAATEMAAQFKRLFNAEVIVTEWPETSSSTHRVLIGSPATNALVQADHAGQWPELSDQGICIRSVASGDGPAIIVGGGSPVATMWAAYEVGHHFGVRYLLHGDILPPQKVQLDLDGLDIVMEPQFRDRAWETLGPFACGHAAWILEEHRRALCQLAKLKYNRVVLAFAPWQPFVHYDFARSRGRRPGRGTGAHFAWMGIPRDGRCSRARRSMRIPIWRQGSLMSISLRRGSPSRAASSAPPTSWA